MFVSHKLMGSQVEIGSVGEKFPVGRFEETHSRFERVLNYNYSDLVVSFVDEQTDSGVLRIVLKGYDLQAVTSIEHYPGVLIMNKEETLYYSPKHIYVSSLPPIHSEPAKIKKELRRIRDRVLQFSPAESLFYLLQDENSMTLKGTLYEKAFRERMQRGYDLLLAGDYSKAVNLFKGSGYGLTPSGDDFLIGLLLGLCFRSRTGGRDISVLRGGIYRLSLGSNSLVNTFLYEAFNGYYTYNWKHFLMELMRCGDHDYYLSSILSQGETSGFDTLSGFLTAYELDI